jgi:hypothetical protein
VVTLFDEDGISLRAINDNVQVQHSWLRCTSDVPRRWMKP